MVDFNALVPWRSNKSQAPATGGDNIFDPFLSFRREMDRMFDTFFDGLPTRSAGGFSIMPVVDVDETEKEMIVTAELPGVSDKDVEVSLAGDMLTIKGEKKTEKEDKNGGYSERRYGSFTRSLRLPFEVKDENVDATFKDGVLSIRLPKPAEMQRSSRKIEVKAQ
jgi:HSP20 family protein